MPSNGQREQVRRAADIMIMMAQYIWLSVLYDCVYVLRFCDISYNSWVNRIILDIFFILTEPVIHSC